MAELPSGTVTLLFSDIEGSTRLARGLGERYPEVLHTHRRLLRDAFTRCGGVEVSTEGDGLFAAFSRAVDAVAGAVNAQRAVSSYPWPADGRVKVRMGLHTGEPVLESGDYTGYDVNRAARICSSGHGGQILVSEVTCRLSESVGGGIDFVDLGEHRLRDLATPERLFQVSAPGLAAHFPPLRSLGVVHSNLPAQLTTFVGRERELQELRDMLLRHRLVTLTGPGGAGKTRLALQAAAGLLGHFPDGVWVVKLAPVTAPELVAQTIATTIGLRDDADQTSVEALTRYAEGKRLLLVLDNFEHLLPAAATVGELISRTAHVNVLVTTREALKIRGERELSIPPMQVPQPRQLMDVGELREIDSVRLFVDRAQEVQPRFQVTSDNAAAVSDIVRQLDGLPLAVELAAARVKVLTPSTLAARLGNRLAVLTGGPRDLPIRQRTLRATIEWSFDLLAEDERTLLARMSTFSGPASLDTVEAVCSWGDIDVLTVLSALVDKSLVRRTEHASGEAFWMLETVKEFAREQLRQGTDASRVKAQHAAHYEQLARRAEPELYGPRQVEWLNRISDEHDDFQAAIMRCLEAGAARRAAVLCAGVAPFWLIRGHYKTGRYWLRKLLDAGLDDPASRGRALVAEVRLAVTQGDLQDVHANLDAAEEAARSGGDELSRARALSERAHVHARLGEEAGRAADQALDIFRRMGEVSAEAEVLLRIGMTPTRRGNYDEATDIFSAALRLMRAAGNSWGAAAALNNIGYLAALQGRLEEALPYLEESRQLAEAVGTREILATVFDTMALVTARSGDLAGAIRLYEQALALYRDMDVREGIAFEQVHLGRALLEHGEHERAAHCLLEGLQLAEQAGEDQSQAFAYEGVAALLTRTGRAREAAALFAAARTFRETHRLPLPPVDRQRIERDQALLASLLDPVSLRDAAQRGARMSRADVQATALAEVETLAARTFPRSDAIHLREADLATRPG